MISLKLLSWDISGCVATPKKIDRTVKYLYHHSSRNVLLYLLGVAVEEILVGGSKHLSLFNRTEKG